MNNDHLSGQCYSTLQSANFYILQARNAPSFIHNYYIATSPIKEVTSVKYLGVQNDNKLTWNDHIHYITHKAAQVNGFLYRNLKQYPPHIKTMCYKTTICPLLEYASYVWDPHTNVNIQKLFKDAQLGSV